MQNLDPDDIGIPAYQLQNATSAVEMSQLFSHRHHCHRFLSRTHEYQSRAASAHPAPSSMSISADLGIASELEVCASCRGECLLDARSPGSGPKNPDQADLFLPRMIGLFL